MQPGPVELKPEPHPAILRSPYKKGDYKKSEASGQGGREKKEVEWRRDWKAKGLRVTQARRRKTDEGAVEREDLSVHPKEKEQRKEQT